MSTLVVVAGRVTVTTEIKDGARADVDLYKGSTLPNDVPKEQVETLLRLGHVAEREHKAPAKKSTASRSSSK